MTTPLAPEEAYAARLAMVREQIESRDVTSPEVLTAMRTVPRHLFVPAELERRAYEDRPLQIAADQTISQPYIVARMSEVLEVGPGDRVLEVGTGSGYQAAVLAEVVSEVYTMEVVPDLARAAEERLRRLCYRNVTVRCGDGALGWPEAAPFDGIMVTCGAPVVPQRLIEQLAPGRRLVMPVGEAGHVMDLRVIVREPSGRVSQETLMPVRFVPLVTPPSP